MLVLLFVARTTYYGSPGFNPRDLKSTYRWWWHPLWPEFRKALPERSWDALYDGRDCGYGLPTSDDLVHGPVADFIKSHGRSAKGLYDLMLDNCEHSCEGVGHQYGRVALKAFLRVADAGDVPQLRRLIRYEGLDDRVPVVLKLSQLTNESFYALCAQALRDAVGERDHFFQMSLITQLHHVPMDFVHSEAEKQVRAAAQALAHDGRMAQLLMLLDAPDTCLARSAADSSLPCAYICLGRGLVVEKSPSDRCPRTRPRAELLLAEPHERTGPPWYF